MCTFPLESVLLRIILQQNNVHSDAYIGGGISIKIHIRVKIMYQIHCIWGNGLQNAYVHITINVHIWWMYVLWEVCTVLKFWQIIKRTFFKKTSQIAREMWISEYLDIWKNEERKQKLTGSSIHPYMPELCRVPQNVAFLWRIDHRGGDHGVL